MEIAVAELGALALAEDAEHIVQVEVVDDGRQARHAFEVVEAEPLRRQEEMAEVEADPDRGVVDRLHLTCELVGKMAYE